MAIDQALQAGKQYSNRFGQRLVNGWSMALGNGLVNQEKFGKVIFIGKKQQNYLNEAIKQAQISKILYVIAQQRSDQSITMLTVFWV